MRSNFMYLFYKSPFENVKKHAETVCQCAVLFPQAVEAHLNAEYTAFEQITDQVAKLESQADAIKRNIRGHMPHGVLMPVDKFQFFMFLREQDGVLDAVEHSLYWLSYTRQPLSEDVKEDLRFFVLSVLPTMEKLVPLVESSIKYFRGNADEDREKVKSLIRDIRQREHESDFLERELIHKVFSTMKDPIQVFHTIRLLETIGSIADHAQNASDMMRAMIAR